MTNTGNVGASPLFALVYYAGEAFFFLDFLQYCLA